MGIFLKQQMIEEWTKMILEYPLVKKWLVKLDNNFVGSIGIAVLDVSKHLPYYKTLVTEDYERYRDQWDTEWAREAARNSIELELFDTFMKHLEFVKPSLWFKEGAEKSTATFFTHVEVLVRSKLPSGRQNMFITTSIVSSS